MLLPIILMIAKITSNLGTGVGVGVDVDLRLTTHTDRLFIFIVILISFGHLFCGVNSDFCSKTAVPTGVSIIGAG